MTNRHETWSRASLAIPLLKGLIMLREPKKAERRSQVRLARKPGRFQLVKLEERIAPTCHYNPHGKKVGCDPKTV